jgi:hypothetical protein
MQLEMGSTPAPGVGSRRPRRVAGPRAESLCSESVRGAEKVTGEGASHDARGGRAPPLQHRYGLGKKGATNSCRREALWTCGILTWGSPQELSVWLQGLPRARPG